MFENLKDIKEKYEQLTQKIGDPEIIKDMHTWQKMVKERADIEEIVNKYTEYENILKNIEETGELINESADAELKNMAEEELSELKVKKENLEKEIMRLLIPKDPNDEKNVIMEIRAGAGGDEAALFASDLYRMYTMYAESKKWKTDIMSLNQTDIGGYKEIIFMIIGKGAYSKLKYESGVHRVQRIPTTEAGGRIHTSTATVAVLPEVEDVEVDINPQDLKIDVYRASGHGGQSVNTTDSAVRVTHIPTGMVVTFFDENSHLKNKDKVIKVLRARLYEIAQREKEEELKTERKSMVGSGDRSERIRTYNFPQGRVTDHRINLTLYRLQDILNGNIDEFINTLSEKDNEMKMNEQADIK